MTGFFRKATVALAATLALGAAAKAVFSVDDVNLKVKEILAPFNNATTKAGIQFTELLVDDVKVRRFGAVVGLDKVGPENHLILTFPQLKYKNDRSVRYPTFLGRAELSLDLVKIMGQKQLDAMAPEVADMIKEMAEEFLKEYGDAGSVNAAVDELSKDQDGHVTKLRFHLTLTTDFSRLKPGQDVTDLELISGDLRASVNRNGASVAVRLEMNPKYKGFQKDGKGLKEFIEALLANDKATYDSIEEAASFANAIAESVVHQKAQD